MNGIIRGFLLPIAVVGALTAAACAPAAAPSPTAAPAKPTAAPAAKPAEKPATVASPAAKPAEQPAAKASPAAQPAAKPAEAKPAASPQPAAKPAAKFDAKAVEEFYRGKQVKIVVGFSAGGGYDTYARLLSRHLGRHIPGNPTILVENMAGAGSLLAANTVYTTAPKDGTVLTSFIGGMISQKIVAENPAVQFDPAKYNWIGAPTPDTAACAVRKESGFTELNQALTKEIILGGTAPGSTTDDIPRTLRAALGLKVKLVSGYGGTADIRLAADKGEINGGCWGWESISVTWKEALEKKEVNVLGQGGSQKHRDLQNVPHFLDLAKTDEAKKLIQAGIVAPGAISRTFAMPPEVPADRVAAIRAAFLSALGDPALLDDAKKASLDIAPVPADEINARIKDLLELPPALKEQLKKALADT